jgi:oligoendopeptidase F
MLVAERIQLNNVRTQQQVLINQMQARIDNLERDMVQASKEEHHRWGEMDMVSEARVRLQEAKEELGRELTSLRGNALVSLLDHGDHRVRIGVGHAFLCGIAVLARKPVKHHLNAQNRTANTCQRAGSSNVRDSR